MLRNRPFSVVVMAVALVVVLVVVAVGWRFVRGDGSLLRDVTVAHQRITPNADNETDVTTIEYTLTRNATVSIHFEDEDGRRYYFRNERPRGAGEYRVNFSGVVDGYLLPEEEFAAEIVTRLLRDGLYTWVVEAEGTGGEVDRVMGQITIADADPVLPEIRALALDRTRFTPNRDGIDDRVKISFFLAKEVEPLGVQLFLEMPDGTKVPVGESPSESSPGDRGYHTYDYAGGVDDGVAPPPDSTYPVVVIVEDAEGQKVRAEEELTIALGGVPYASFVPPATGDTVLYNTTAVEICDTLYFTTTVENYGDTPIRTTGPWSGAVYDSNWNYNTMGWSTESGAWRLGIGYENALGDYPYRWGLGTPDSLTIIDGFYYLMPGERTTVTGGIRVVDRFGVRNPQPIWAGLIHEDVEIAQRNNRVDTHLILVDLPDPDHRPACGEREPPS